MSAPGWASADHIQESERTGEKRRGEREGMGGREGGGEGVREEGREVPRVEVIAGSKL